MSEREPIRMRCPGSGHPGNDLGEYLAYNGAPSIQIIRHCAYCNAAAITGVDFIIPEHETDDLLAMIDRGDFR